MDRTKFDHKPAPTNTMEQNWGLFFSNVQNCHQLLIYQFQQMASFNLLLCGLIDQ